MPDTAGADQPSEGATNDTPSMSVPEKAAVLALLGFVLAAAAGGFAISVAVGFFCLAGSLLTSALLLGWQPGDSASKEVKYTYVPPERFGDR